MEQGSERFGNTKYTRNVLLTYVYKNDKSFRNDPSLGSYGFSVNHAAETIRVLLSSVMLGEPNMYMSKKIIDFSIKSIFRLNLYFLISRNY